MWYVGKSYHVKIIFVVGKEYSKIGVKITLYFFRVNVKRSGPPGSVWSAVPSIVWNAVSVQCIDKSKKKKGCGKLARFTVYSSPFPPFILPFIWGHDAKKNLPHQRRAHNVLAKVQFCFLWPADSYTLKILK